MSFPETRLSLIRRLAGDAAASDWQDFLADYWGPVCRFAQARASISSHDAEDVTAQVFQTLWESDLLERWNGNQAARLRTMDSRGLRSSLWGRLRSGVWLVW